MKIGIPAGFVGLPFFLLLDLRTAPSPAWGGRDIGIATGIVTSWDDVDWFMAGDVWSICADKLAVDLKAGTAR